MSGWATATVDAPTEDNADRLRAAFNDGLDGDHDGAMGGNGTSVDVLSWGYGSGGVKRILRENTHLWERAVVMEANDTSDSGSGTAYESDGGEMEALDSASGAERARGHDAAADLRQYIEGHVYMR